MSIHGLPRPLSRKLRLYAASNGSFDTKGRVYREAQRCDMLEIVTGWTTAIATLLDAFAAVLTALASLEAAVRSVLALAKIGQEHRGLQPIRWRYGRWLTLVLDFLIAADILRTAVAPSWTQIGQLAAIIVLRTLIAFTLAREIRDDAPASTQPTGD